MKIKEDPVLVYDIEVFFRNWMVVIKNTETLETRVWHNDNAGLDEWVHSGWLVGYNNFNYDDRVLTKILYDPYPLAVKSFNDRLFLEMRRVENADAEHENKWIDNRKFPVMRTLKTLDLTQEITTDPLPPALKFIAANLGENIHESSVDFDIDRKLTDEEVKLSIEYCINDVHVTERVCEYRYNEYFLPKLFVGEMLVDLKGFTLRDAMRKKVTKMVDILFGGGNAHTPFRPTLDKFLEEGLIPKELHEFWSRGFEKGVKHSILEFNNIIDFGWGGIHGTYIGEKSWVDEDIWHIDVNSMYPSIIILLGILGTNTPFYEELYHKRIADKKAKIMYSANGLKLALNKEYGILGNKYFESFNEEGMNLTCIYGQTALYNLGKDVAHLGKLLQFNTDGIMFLPNEGTTKEQVEEAIVGWEERFGLTMAIDMFHTLVQKDVNNYVAIEVGHDDDPELKGELSYNNDGMRMMFKSWNLSITHKAVFEYLVNGTPLRDTICNPDEELRRYQSVFKVNKTYPYISDESTGERIYNKVNRMFLVQHGGGTYKKVKHTKFDEINKKYVKVVDRIATLEKDMVQQEKDKETMTKLEFKEKWKSGVGQKLKNAYKSRDRYKEQLAIIEKDGYIETYTKIQKMDDGRILIKNDSIEGCVKDYPELAYILDYQLYIKKAEEMLARYV